MSKHVAWFWAMMLVSLAWQITGNTVEAAIFGCTGAIINAMGFEK